LTAIATKKSPDLKHCPECDKTISVGVDIIKNPDDKWIHRTCYDELGYDKKRKIIWPGEFWNLDDDDD